MIWVTEFSIIYFLGIKLFCFSSIYLKKNFVKPHKISTHLAYSDDCYFHLFLSVVWLSWNFARFHKIQFQTEPESFSFLSWKTKKFYSWKNKFFKRLSISKQKSFVYWLNFPEGFGFRKHIQILLQWTLFQTINSKDRRWCGISIFEIFSLWLDISQMAAYV